MTVLDAYAVLSLLKGEPAALNVQQLLNSAECGLTALGIAEVVDHLVRIVGATEEDAALDLAQLGLMAPGPVDAELAFQAGLLRARHYDRRSRAVSLADCVAAEVARSLNSEVGTSDPQLLDLCRDEGVGVAPLPDSHGATWSP